ncbi:MAG: tetratricopeptide repeat protein, partial [Xanthobacteraceae bacterium]
MHDVTYFWTAPLRRLPLAAILFGALLAAVLPVRAQDQSQDPTNERRCTGQLRASVDERIAACTTLIDSGRYQPVNLAILHDNRGSAYRVKGDPTSARKDFDDAVTLNPGYARAFANRGSLLLAQHDLDGAITDLNQAISLDANDAGMFMTRGNAYDEKNDFDHAIADYNEAIRLSPNYGSAYFNRGLAFRRKGNL